MCLCGRKPRKPEAFDEEDLGPTPFRETPKPGPKGLKEFTHGVVPMSSGSNYEKHKGTTKETDPKPLSCPETTYVPTPPPNLTNQPPQFNLDAGNKEKTRNSDQKSASPEKTIPRPLLDDSSTEPQKLTSDLEVRSPRTTMPFFKTGGSDYEGDQKPPKDYW